MRNEELVSIVVVSYNAEFTIIETLDSIKSQTYISLELIVSDDNSKDNTLLAIKSWLNENSSRFVRTSLISSEINTGVCSNLNRAHSACSGKWIKVIAADDKLLPNCISDFINFVNESNSINFVCSLARVYQNKFEEDNYLYTLGCIKNDILSLNAESQLKYIAYNHNIIACSIFYSRSMIEKLNGFDERYGYEDHPLYISMLENGYRIFFLPKETVCYRVHESMVNSDTKLFNIDFIMKSKRFRKERCFKYLNRWQKISLNFLWVSLLIMDKLNMNRKTSINEIVYHGIKRLVYSIGKIR